jgi:periplasmic divalent cation tolerance protein
MPPTRRHAVAFVTAPDLKTARRLATVALEARACACASLVPRFESHYWWQGRIEHGNEVFLMFKTVKSSLPALEAIIRAHHPYDTPEFIVLPIAAGAARYLAWIDAVTAPPAMVAAPARARKGSRK